MPGSNNFEHLPLVLRYDGLAKLHGGGKSDLQTEANKLDRSGHSLRIGQQSQEQVQSWSQQQEAREADGMPPVPSGIPLLLRVDPNLDVDKLRHHFEFEILGADTDGYVIAASADPDLSSFRNLAVGFASEVRGSANVASIHMVYGPLQQQDRLNHLLSEHLLQQWPSLNNDQPYIIDVGVACVGTVEIPEQPKRNEDESEETWVERLAPWKQKRQEAINAREDLKCERESDVCRMVLAYQAEMLSCVENPFDAGVLPDSFTIRLRISGKGLKDFVLNYPFIFEVTEPEDIDLPQTFAAQQAAELAKFTPVGPDNDAPSICVIDSGIQEGHPYLAPAINTSASHCFLPGYAPTDVGDGVASGGHGTRVAGAVLYGENIPTTGSPKLPFYIQNARVLNNENNMPSDMFPPEIIRRAVERYNVGSHPTRIFNHSINTRGPCRTGFMSAWAAEIDQISYERDVLIVQSAGNVSARGTGTHIGIGEHIQAGRNYPGYLQEASCRVSNPGHSLQALTVGSIAYGASQHQAWQTFAGNLGDPSAFSRSGPGIWNVIKPEVVEYGGDMIRNGNSPPDIASGGVITDACPNLVRSTLHAPGPPVDRDATGTSFAAPKVAHIAAHLQNILPDQTTLLYRGLIVQSAQWPDWAENILQRLREPPKGSTKAQKQEWRQAALVAMRSLGYGLPSLERASSNTDHRTTLITTEEIKIKAGSGHIFQVPVPAVLRGQADEFEVRIDVTLSYVARPRRTRRDVHKYLSTWLEWKTSNLGESMDNFRVRALKNATHEDAPVPGKSLPWTLNGQAQHGHVAGFKRSDGTVQKDWAVVRSNALPDNFCVAVIGHQGWSDDPDDTAQYSLAVTFEVLGGEVAIYEPLRIAIEELESQLETRAEVQVEINS